MILPILIGLSFLLPVEPLPHVTLGKQEAYAYQDNNAIIIDQAVLTKNWDQNFELPLGEARYGIKFNYTGNVLSSYSTFYSYGSINNQNYYSTQEYQCDYTLTLKTTYRYFFVNNNVSNVVILNYTLTPIMTWTNTSNGATTKNPTFTQSNLISQIVNTYCYYSAAVTNVLGTIKNQAPIAQNTNVKLMTDKNQVPRTISEDVTLAVVSPMSDRTIIDSWRDIIQFEYVIGDDDRAEQYGAGFQNGYTQGYNQGNEQGYQQGLTDGMSTPGITGVNNLFSSIFGIVDNILQIELLPNFKLWYFLAIPLLFGGVKFVIGMFI